jgi:hypothetical protein
MPENPADADQRSLEEIANCDSTRGETFCVPKHMCVQNWEGGKDGPCEAYDIDPLAPAVVNTAITNPLP